MSKFGQFWESLSNYRQVPQTKLDKQFEQIWTSWNNFGQGDIQNKTEKPFSLQDDEKEGTIMTELVKFFITA